MGPEKSQRFLSNTGPDPPFNHKAIKLAFNGEPSSAHRWRFAGGLVMAANSGI